MSTIPEIACDAIELIETHGWVQGTFGNEEVGYCLFGAIEKAAHKGGKAVSMECEDIRKAIVDKTQATSVAYWNDTEGRTKEEVIELLRSFCG